jgi:hypothetical protein
MRKRALPLILVAVVAWVIGWRLTQTLMQTPFGYELGSVAFPTPTYLRAIAWFAMLSFVVGLSLFTFDLVQWIRTRHK